MAVDVDSPIDLRGPLQPVFLGGQQTNTSVLLQFNMVNSNGIVMEIAAEGYLWDAEAATMPGGPRKFPNGLYP